MAFRADTAKIARLALTDETRSGCPCKNPLGALRKGIWHEPWGIEGDFPMPAAAVLPGDVGSEYATAG